MDKARYGGLNQDPICVPSVLGPMLICFLFPPFFVIAHELYKEPNNRNLNNIIISIILTSLFYFPGLIFGMSLMRTEGTWVDNYSGLP
jgi:hypothetical protein